MDLDPPTFFVYLSKIQISQDSTENLSEVEIHLSLGWTIGPVDIKIYNIHLSLFLVCTF